MIRKCKQRLTYLLYVSGCMTYPLVSIYCLLVSTAIWRSTNIQVPLVCSKYLYLDSIYVAHAGREINLLYPGLRYLCPLLSGTKKHKCEKYNITLFSTGYTVCFINLSHSLTISLCHGHNLHRRMRRKGKLVN